MKRQGVLNVHLAAELARLGHTDLVVVGDCGLPRPPGVTVVDLAVVMGIPTFEEVLRVLADEIVAEASLVASEASDANPRIIDLVTELFQVPEQISHEEFKKVSGRANLFVRTGEASPYANVILTCGVPF